jgi:predicted RNase H-like HicB family nuclease
MATTATKAKTTKAATKQYRVQFERDESGWWVASVPAVQGCHTQGRTLNEARRRIREALGLFVEDAETATLIDNVKMPKPLKIVLREFKRTRANAERAQATARERARKAVRLLSGGAMRLSRRDTAHVLGLSPQRIQQLTKESGRS